MNPADPSLFVVFLVLLLMLQAGFLVFESGTIREKNAFNTATKNLSDILVGMAIYFLMLLMTRMLSTLSLQGVPSVVWPSLQPHDLIAACFAVSCITISSGAIAERMRFESYLMLCAFSAGITYPIIEWLSWQPSGLLYEYGFKDRAGSGVVHTTGGAIALAAAHWIGPRIGRFDRSQRDPFPLGNVVFVCLGCLLMLIGWFGFNLSSLPEGSSDLPLACLIIMLSCLSGGLYGLFSSYDPKMRIFNVRPIFNGILGGLVAVTASFDALSQLQAVFVGLAGGFVACRVDKWVSLANIDDPVSAIGVHLGAGLFGVLATSMTADSSFPIQLLGAGTIFVVSYGLTLLFLKATEKITGPMRPTAEEEMSGLNLAEHGSPSLADELYTTIATQAKDPNWDARARVEPYTSIGAIAARYNEVMSRLQEEFQSRLEVIDQGAKGQLRIAALAHDLRNPIHALKGEAFLVSAKIKSGNQLPSERLSKTVAVIEEQCKQIDDIINSVLSHSKKRYFQESKSAEALWPAALAKTKNLFMNQIRDLKITVILPSNTPQSPIAIPEIQLVRVLANLMNNSIRALQESPPGEERQIIIRITEDKSNYFCSFEDNGPGIGNEIMPKLFEPFLTSQKDGHGVGLAASKMILHDFGGDIWLKSQKPTQFMISIPRGEMKGNLLSTE